LHNDFGDKVYRIKDYNGEDIKGTFYQSELQKITVTDVDLWKVENVLRPSKFNSWVKATDVHDI